MKANVRVLGHALHPILVAFPLGMSAGVVAMDILGYYHPGSDAWPKGAFVLLALAVASGLFAGIIGFADWLGIPKGTRAKRIGLFHAASNLVSLSLLGISLAMRSADPTLTDHLAAGISTAGVLLFGLGGWLGGELVERLGMGVDPEANPDAPSSLGGQPNLARVDRAAHVAGAGR